MEQYDNERYKTLNLELVKAIREKNGRDIKYFLECLDHYQRCSYLDSDPDRLVDLLLLPSKRSSQEGHSYHYAQSRSPR